MPDSVCLIVNPIAGGFREARLARAVEKLRQSRGAVKVRRSTGPGDCNRFAAEAAAAGFRTIAAMGGDGTVNEVVNGIPPRADVALGVFPTGTANVLAHELGLARDPDGAARTLLHGRRCHVRMGVVNSRRFLLMAGMGFDADVVRMVTHRAKQRYGRFAYIRAGIFCLRAQRDREFQVQSPVWSGRAGCVIVSRARHYAGPFVLAPRAALTSPGFEVTVFGPVGPWAVCRYVLGIACGRVHRLRGVQRFTAPELTVVSRNGGGPMQLDGDVGPDLPAQFRVHPQSLQILVPE